MNAVRKHYPANASTIISQTEENYLVISKDTAFSFTSKNPIDRRLDFSAYFLALIKTLDAHEEIFDSIRSICLEITIAYVQPKNKMHRYTKQILPKLTNTWAVQKLFRQLNKKVSVNNNSDGFIANIITEKRETHGLGYGVDIIECGICKLFNKHGFAKYAGILCEVDEVTSALAGLKLIRTGTIANGAKKCDFRFQRI